MAINEEALVPSESRIVKSTEHKTEAQIWGLTANELHVAWWSGQGVQVVHRDAQFEESPGVEVFLLLPEHRIVVFDLGEVVEELVWSTAAVIAISVSNRDPEKYREELLRAPNEDVVGITRSYDFSRLNRVSGFLTSDSDIAESWAKGTPNDEFDGEQSFESDLIGHTYDPQRTDERTAFILWLVASWADPARVLRGIEEIEKGVFGPTGAEIPEQLLVVPPVWLGFDLGSNPERILAGPEFRSDGIAGYEDQRKPEPRSISDIEIPGGRSRKRLLPRRTFYGLAKRSFDFSVALVAIVLLSPVFLLISIIIVIDDGFPLFFGHTRQARGGREFRCFKFRTMRRDAESMVEGLKALNKADGPQVFIENDPRVTRVGKLLREFQMDELPQFWNVIRGDMSFVGPRPSPDRENQFCPAWRELRLSVRPGITGLWQVSRTRASGEDFQEWIKFDIEYVRTASFFGDLKIIFRTVRGLFTRS